MVFAIRFVGGTFYTDWLRPLSRGTEVRARTGGAYFPPRCGWDPGSEVT